MRLLLSNLVATVGLVFAIASIGTAAMANPCDGCFPTGSGGCSLYSCYIDGGDNLVGCKYQCGCEFWTTNPDGSGGSVNSDNCDGGTSAA
jgi:hypothetical protein